MTTSSLEQAIQNKTATVGVIGLGYVGLPLIRAFIASGFRTMGFDVDQAKVDQLLTGRSYIKHIPAEWIAEHVADGRFVPTADMRRLGRARRLADLRAHAAERQPRSRPDLHRADGRAYRRRTAARATRRPGEHDLSRHHTRRRTADPRRRAASRRAAITSSLSVPSGKIRAIRITPPRRSPKSSAASTPRAAGWPNCSMARRWPRSCRYRTAKSPRRQDPGEHLSLGEYRPGQRAEGALHADGHQRLGSDRCGEDKPFGFQAFYPGPGLGGHCIPIDPFYLTWLARRNGMTTRFIELAGEINTAMPEYVIHRLVEALNDRSKPLRGSKIALLGVAYKKDVDDPRESPSFKLMELLLAGGATLTYNDPHVPRLPRMRHYDVPDMTSCPSRRSILAAQDAVLIATDHSAYDYDFIVRHAKLVIDTRNATKKVSEGREKIVKA